ncbi:hypothetical protein [Parasitella parasitica]|uniref:Integrase catalytic domain-containing protein n=1 Tax=Parasitella parasitica TaxID=35722 RepID=A0A0B7MXZ7_9FUNG|nr:hypothetical protein [Parasitella parasitica]
MALSLLWRNKFHLFLDNQGLLYIHSQEKLSRMIENFYETIFEFDFDITYTSGMDNILADRLSRIFVPDKKKLEGSGKLARKAAVMRRAIDSVESSNNNNDEHAKKQKIDSKENTKSSIIPDVDDEQYLNKTASPENKQQDTDLFIYASHLDVYETPKDEEQKKQLLEKSHLLGHYGKHVFHPPKNHTAKSIGDHWVFDLGRFDVTTPRGNNSILVAMDLFSRFIVLRALPNKAAPTVAKKLVSIFSLFGYLTIISHDNEQRLTLPYTPYGNSACEAAVKSAKAIIIKMLDGCAENWDLYLDGTAYSLNLHKSRLHGMKPFVVMFARLPNELKDYSAEQVHLTRTRIRYQSIERQDQKN